MINPISGFSSYGSYGSSSVISQLNPASFDYKAAQSRLQKAIKNDTSNEKISAMKKDTADFLDNYTKSMQQTKGAAQDVNAALQKTLSDASGNNGKVSDEALKKATDAVQKMVDTYNSAQTLMTKNADRGTGIASRQQRLESAMGSESALKGVSITADKNGKLSFDADTLKKALSGTDGERKLAVDTLSGTYGISGRVASAATSALNQNPSSLVNNDLQDIKAVQETQRNTLLDAIGAGSSSFGTYSRAGAYTMMNMGTVGMLMNMMV